MLPSKCHWSTQCNFHLWTLSTCALIPRIHNTILVACPWLTHSAVFCFVFCFFLCATHYSFFPSGTSLTLSCLLCSCSSPWTLCPTELWFILDNVVPEGDLAAQKNKRGKKEGDYALLPGLRNWSLPEVSNSSWDDSLFFFSSLHCHHHRHRSWTHSVQITPGPVWNID